jgi:hypothetical protein
VQLREIYLKGWPVPYFDELGIIEFRVTTFGYWA